MLWTIIVFIVGFCMGIAATILLAVTLGAVEHQRDIISPP